jgi:predicted nucleotidyltransferase
MLAKLLRAAGHQLELAATPIAGAPPGLPDTPMGRRLRRRRGAVLEACDRRGASNVRLFGSVARGEDSDSSDVDLLVDLDERVGMVSLIGLERELSELLGVDVDVVPAGSIKPRLRDAVAAEAIPL